MNKFFRADELFKDLPNDMKLRIFEIAKGKMVYFPKNADKKQLTDKKEMLIRYAADKKRSYSEVGKEFNISKMRVCQIVNQEREKFSKERVRYWKRRGLSLREIARLFKKSHERVRQMVEMK